jgi:hypothetical protein
VSVKAVRYLLANNVTLTATVPATRIMAGPLPQSIALPVISILQVSRVPITEMLTEESVRLWRGRVQVTVFANSYTDMRSVLALVRGALPRSRGTVNGVKVESVLLDNEGPDMADEDSGIFLGSVDVTVTFNE